MSSYRVGGTRSFEMICYRTNSLTTFHQMESFYGNLYVFYFMEIYMYFILWKSICILFYGNLYVFYFMEIYMYFILWITICILLHELNYLDLDTICFLS